VSLPDHLLSDNKVYAARQLANYLKEGTLVLVTGAGASRGVGLPLWWQLVSRCLAEVGDSRSTAVTEATSNKELRRLMEGIESGVDFARYREIVRRSLYHDVQYSDSIIQQRLLISFGALLMGSRRGKIRTVINFNFDDVLEWYLQVHGFETQTISKVPSLTKEVDVVVYHPHGFLPYRLPETLASDFLIFSEYSYDERLGEEKNPWIRLTKEALLGKVGLFVGLSGEDPIFGPLLVDVKGQIGSQRPTGFWLLGPGEINVAEFERRNVIPLQFESYEKIPGFLLKVCQYAAGIQDDFEE
jgi:hypothetical protein